MAGNWNSVITGYKQLLTLRDQMAQDNKEEAEGASEFRAFAEAMVDLLTQLREVPDLSDIFVWREMVFLNLYPPRSERILTVIAREKGNSFEIWDSDLKSTEIPNTRISLNRDRIVPTLITKLGSMRGK